MDIAGRCKIELLAIKRKCLINKTLNQKNDNTYSRKGMMFVII